MKLNLSPFWEEYRDVPPEDLGEGYCYEGPHDSSEEAFEQVFAWHTEKHDGRYEPFDHCDIICEAQTSQVSTFQR